MERKDYLELIRCCAGLKRGLFGVAVEVPDKWRVMWRGIEYYPEAYTLEYDIQGKVVHKCRLHDLKANAVVGAPLHEVQPKIAPGFPGA